MIMHLPDAGSKLKLLIPTVYTVVYLKATAMRFSLSLSFFTPLILLTCNFEMNFTRPLLPPY